MIYDRIYTLYKTVNSSRYNSKLPLFPLVKRTVWLRLSFLHRRLKALVAAAAVTMPTAVTLTTIIASLGLRAVLCTTLCYVLLTHDLIEPSQPPSKCIIYRWLNTSSSTVVYSTTISCLNLCNNFLFGLPASTFAPLKSLIKMIFLKCVVSTQRTA